MPLKKQKQDLKIAVLVPCYQRPEYTKRAMKALCAAGEYDIAEHPGDKGLRNAIIDFIDATRGKYDIIAKMDNDCLVPVGWMSTLIDIFGTTDVDIISPNVLPSNAAFLYGKDTEDELGYRKAEIVGGLWCMRSEMVDDMVFTRYDTEGIKGAIPLLRQIVNEKKPNIGWTTRVTVEDLGHWSGAHPEHIKSKEHEEYSKEVGRDIAWTS